MRVIKSTQKHRLGVKDLVPQDDWQQDTPSDEGMCSPELSVNTNMPQCRETPLSRPGLPHRTPQSQRFARSAAAGCTAVEDRP
ncbi:uncharacterized protein LOC143714451 isoform X3 [Siphateles boraxobius]|uniref:uncharacterized protein LOC143714451 isoform X3 n=1 Tax=Siphateles boraxobius TaxID=180520 RepID=UPI0040636CAA